MTTTTRKTNANETARKSSAEIRAALADAEHARREAAKMLDNNEAGGEQAHEAADRDCRKLSDWLAAAEAREREEQQRSTANSRRETAARLTKEACEFSIERRNAFRDDFVREGLEIKRRLDDLYLRQQAAKDEARAAKERIEAEAAAAGIPAPMIPVWAGFTNELGAAIAQDHDRRRPDTSGLPRHLRHLKEGQVAMVAERARAMLVPWRGHVSPAADSTGPEEERAS